MAATELIERDGLAGLSAREIARRIGYSPGTLYNVFENLDALVLTIEARLLDRLAARLGELPHQETPEARVLALARAYLAFTHENPKLWNLLFEHHMPAGKAVPSWYQTKLDGLMTRIEEAVARPVCSGRVYTVSRRCRQPTSCRTSRQSRPLRWSRISSRPILPD